MVAEIFVIEKDEIVWGGSFSFYLFIDTSEHKARLYFSNITDTINEMMKDAYEELV